MTDQNQTFYLLSIPGKLAPKTQEAARQIHNETAGAPANVAAARALGDLSHMVYVPVDNSAPAASDFLILDQWNKLDGLNTFFADPHVQEGGGLIFSQRDPVVWMPAPGFTSYHFPAPAAKPDRYIGVVRGMVKSVEDACEKHNAVVNAGINQARAAGNISHEAYLRLAQPGSPEALEFLAVDTWMDLASMGQYYNQPGFMETLVKMFAGMPSATVWAHPAGNWVEW
jgi:hypothetical protein